MYFFNHLSKYILFISLTALLTLVVAVMMFGILDTWYVSQQGLEKNWNRTIAIPDIPPRKDARSIVSAPTAETVESEYTDSVTPSNQLEEDSDLTSTDNLNSSSSSVTKFSSNNSYYQEKAATGTENWKTFINKKYGFSLQYPPKWQATFQEIDPENNYYDLVIVSADGNYGLEFGRNAIGFGETTAIDSTPVSIGGIDATRTVLQDELYPEQFYILVTTDDINTKEYQSIFASYGTSNKDITEIFEKIVGTIVLD